MTQEEKDVQNLKLSHMHYSNYISASAPKVEGGRSRQGYRLTVMHISTFIGYSSATAAGYVRGEIGRQDDGYKPTQHFSVRQMPRYASLVCGGQLRPDLDNDWAAVHVQADVTGSLC